MIRNNFDNNVMIHSFGTKDTVKPKNFPVVIIFPIIIIAGIVSGYFLSRTSTTETGGAATQIVQQQGSKKTVGSTDVKTFKDQAEGILKSGGIDGEGTHKLERPGGESQTVYLTSSVLDLNEFVGKKVRVWGETHAGEKAGWLMDVGRVEILE